MFQLKLFGVYAGGISAPVREAPRSAPKPRVEETPKPTPAAEANQGPADMEVDGDTPAKRVATGTGLMIFVVICT
eukprot:g1010.t1